MLDQSSTESQALLPLYVDLDGTLIKSDLLIETAFALIKKEPMSIFRLPIWALQGKAKLKTKIAERVGINPGALPYQNELVSYLQEQVTQGRSVYLASASEGSLVRSIASHFGFFSGVLATDASANLKGAKKAAAIVTHSEGTPFVYAGNEKVDVAVWTKAAEGIVVNGGPAIEKAARKVTSVSKVFDDRNHSLLPYLKAIRLHQWLKNVLLFVPFIALHQFDWQSLVAVGIAFLAFGLCASSTYILNDLLDLEADRQHPSKRLRPLASGQVSLIVGLVSMVVLMIGGLLVAAMLSWAFLLSLLSYIFLTLLYSLYIKRRVLADVLVLAALYTLRIIAGAVAINVAPSAWLLAFSTFLFFSLALVKRCCELGRMADLDRSTTSGRDYRVSDLPVLSAMGIASGYLSVLVLALYIDSPTATELYRRPMLLWLLCPLALYWVSRLWIKTARKEMHDDPLVYSARDCASWIVFFVAALTWVAAFSFP